MNLAYLALVLAQLGLADDVRHDSKLASVLSRQLETVKKTVYEIQYPALKARDLVPVSHEADPATESIVYSEWDKFGMASIIGNYADDLPMVGVLAEQFTQRVLSLGDGYQYSVMDIRRAVKAGVPLTTRFAAVAREMVERKIDDLTLFGHGQAGIKGALNHPNVTVVHAVDPGAGQVWASDATNLKNAEEMRADLDLLVKTIITQTKGVHEPDTIVMPLDEFTRFAQVKTGLDSPSTLLKEYLSTSPYIKAIIPYFKLGTADEARTGPRIWAYKRDPSVFTVEIPQEWEQFPPQAVNLAFKVPCHARFGGTIMYQPLAMAYLDGV